MGPVVDRLAKEFEGVVDVQRVNVEKDAESADLASGFGVTNVPTFVFLKADGTTVDTLIGEFSEDALRDYLDALR